MTEIGRKGGEQSHGGGQQQQQQQQKQKSQSEGRGSNLSQEDRAKGGENSRKAG